MDDPSFGEYLKSLREKQRMSLREAEKESGVSNAYIAQIERGDRPAPSPDILRKLSQLKTRQIVVGFAAETHDLEAEARRKLKEKNLDLIVANDVARTDSGFAVDTNQVTVLSREGEPLRLPLLSKDEVADRLLDRVAELFEARGEDKGGA